LNRDEYKVSLHRPAGDKNNNHPHRYSCNEIMENKRVLSEKNCGNDGQSLSLSLGSNGSQQYISEGNSPKGLKLNN